MNTLCNVQTERFEISLFCDHSEYDVPEMMEHSKPLMGVTFSSNDETYLTNDEEIATLMKKPE